MTQILIVDDEIRNRAHCRHLLEGIGVQILEAGEGTAAMGKLSKDTGINLVVTDLVMPLVNGFELIKIIRNQWPHIPVVAMSGSVALTTAAEDLGADAVFLRPLLEDEFRNICHSLATRS